MAKKCLRSWILLCCHSSFHGVLIFSHQLLSVFRASIYTNTDTLFTKKNSTELKGLQDTNRAILHRRDDSMSWFTYEISLPINFSIVFPNLRVKSYTTFPYSIRFGCDAKVHQRPSTFPVHTNSPT